MNIDNINDLFTKSLALSIPDEFKQAAGTYMSTVKGIIDFIENTINKSAKNYLLSCLEISEEALQLDEVMLNANVLLELEKSMQKLNLSKEHMNEMSMYVNFTNQKRAVIPEVLQGCSSELEVAQKMVELSNNTYDKNFRYHIEKEGDRFKIVGISNEEVHDVLKKQMITGDQITHFKAYTVANTTLDLFGKSMKLIKVNNFYKNSRQCQEYIFKDQSLTLL